MLERLWCDLSLGDDQGVKMSIDPVGVGGVGNALDASQVACDAEALLTTKLPPCLAQQIDTLRDCRRRCRNRRARCGCDLIVVASYSV